MNTSTGLYKFSMNLFYILDGYCT